ncbi:SDR family NAD(P)-dependent oxidoreductase [Anaerocolumna sedimenticola]|uniref:SDR family NAD(P)-dependent oxidoreductase n=1 Tax=Anaerocolumna sedimenticola TaxID=2696063 RepID=A0A6P1TVC8_9FIRM|nr:SDR family NAD(P)-dependent oxidoreductase [Anaerocolumna sedimenticola]QHQ63375.1 SDR family NAD(P)-dependent oxidoreductase [Anaerocolumna sedimenticola]
MYNLEGKIAVITGASRGVGKGVALGLAEYGATVYVTGRTVSSEGLPDFLKNTTIQETANEVNQLGGIGIVHRCDFSKDEEITKLFERVQREQGRIDILVNNAWAAADHIMNEYFFQTPFWEQPMSLYDDLHTVGLRSSYLASRYAAQMMVKQHSGLIANISYISAKKYWLNVSNGLFKAAIDKFTSDASHELKKYGVKMFSIYPGNVRTEGMIELSKYDPSLRPEEMETPQFVGRCIAALEQDESNIEQSGEVLRTEEIGLRYGITDIDGRQPRAV